jgi:hypothetical protein
MEFSEDFTAPLQARYPEILNEVLAKISSIAG